MFNSNNTAIATNKALNSFLAGIINFIGVINRFVGIVGAMVNIKKKLFLSKK